MRAQSPLDDLLAGRTSVRVLRVLSLFPEKEFTGRELAEAAGAAPSNAIIELERLRKAGVVHRRTLGRAHVWRANRRHALFRMLSAMFEEEHGLADRLIEALREGTDDPRIARSILFGSFARGDEGPESDVDLLVLTRRAADVEGVRRLLDALAERLSAEFGLRLAPIVHAQSELPRLRRTALLKEIAKEGRAMRGAPL